MEQMEMQEESPVRRRITWSEWVTKRKIKTFALNLLVAVIVYFVCRMTILKDVEKPAQCQTVECIQAANHILNYINQTADPCDDFYKFTCGNFQKNNIAMEKKTFLDQMDADIQTILEKLLTSDNLDDSNFSTNLQVARSFYRVCLNRTALNQDKDRTYLETVLKIVGNTDDNPLWQNVTLNARKYGMDFDFFLNVSVAWIQNTHMLLIAPPYKNPFWFNLLWQSNNIVYIKKIYQYWISNDIPEWFLTDPDKIVDFANEFQKIVIEFTPEISDVEPNIRPISELNETDYFNRDWLGFLRELTGVPSLKNSDNIIYLVGNDPTYNYLSKLQDLIERTHWSVWKNYIVISNTAHLSGLLSGTVQQIFQNLIPNGNGRTIPESCQVLTELMFPGEQDREYIKTLMSIEKQNLAQAITDKLKLALVSSVEQILPVKDRSTEVVLDELRNITTVIGSDSKFHNSSYHAQYGKEIVSKNLIDMYFKIKKVETSFFFNYTQMEDIVDTNPAIGTNMYLLSDEYTIHVPASVLQHPIFDTNWPQYLNYGALGSMIGHELIHALVVTYIGFDINPNSEPAYQIGNDTAYFGSCEYNKYLEYLTERHLSTSITTKTMYESMADFGGVNLAYRSYQSWVKEHGPELVLPGLNYTTNQIFWIMSSLHLCHDAKLDDPERMQEYLKSGTPSEYPVPSYRVNGPKRNSATFAEDFKCNSGAKMNPNKKCTPLA